MPAPQWRGERVSTPPLHPSARLVLFTTVFIDLLGFGIVIPFLPLFAARLGVGAAGVGAILSAYSAAQLLCAPVLGRLSDRVGRRPVLMLGLAGSAVGYALYASASSFAWLLFSRVVHGACAATVSTAQAYMADTTPESQRASAMGLIGAAFGLGFVFGPVVGGLLGQTSLRTPAYFASALALANLAFAYFKLPESLTARSEVTAEAGHVRALMPNWFSTLRQRELMRLFAIAFLSTMVFAALETTFALVASAKYGLQPRGVGAALAWAGLVQAVAQGYLVGRLAKTVSETILVRVGVVAMGVGLGPLASFSSTVALFLLLSLAAFGYGLENPSVASLLTKFSSLRSRGEVLGFNQSALSLARIVGPLFAGALYQSAGQTAPYFVSAALMLIALVIGFRVQAPVVQDGRKA